MKYPGDRLTCRHWSMNCRLDWVTRRPRAPCVAVHHHIVCLWVYGSGDLRYQHRNGSMFVRVWEPSEAGSGTCHGMMFKAGWRLRFTHRSASPGSLQWPCAESWRLIRSCVCVRAMAIHTILCFASRFVMAAFHCAHCRSCLARLFCFTAFANTQYHTMMFQGKIVKCDGCPTSFIFMCQKLLLHCW